MDLVEIKSTLKTVYEKYDGIRLGVAGSYVDGALCDDSGIDIVIDGDSMHVDIMEYIKSIFDVEVDLLWVDLMRQEDIELDRFAVEIGLSVNPYSVYKTVMREVQWI